MQDINTNTEEYSTSIHILNFYLSCSLSLDVLLKQENYASASISPDLSVLPSYIVLFLIAQNFGSDWLHQKRITRERMQIFFVASASSFL